LWLRFHEGLAPGAIAARQATTRKTVESRLTRGLALLRAELERCAGGDRERWLSGMLVLARGSELPWIASMIGVGVMKKLVLALVALVVFGLGWELVPRGRSASTAELPPNANVAEDTAAPSLAAAEAHRVALAPEQAA